MMERKKMYLKEKLGKEELLLQLAEEAAELSQAALKLRRTMSIVNPARVTNEKAYENLLEEIADVFLCLNIIGADDKSIIKILDIADYKMERWIVSIKEKEAEEKTVVKEHAKLCDEIKEVYKNKNAAYGNSFSNGRREIKNYTLAKLHDKYTRFKNLTLHPENANYESVNDTLLDMANYCLMELAERRAEKSI